RPDPLPRQPHRPPHLRVPPQHRARPQDCKRPHRRRGRRPAPDPGRHPRFPAHRLPRRLHPRLVRARPAPRRGQQARCRRPLLGRHPPLRRL
ncbi:hypothetical protein BN1723_020094, partial [Verticillium longisporum]